MEQEKNFNPIVICPICGNQEGIHQVLTAQSNQNVIYQCERCEFERRNIVTKKG
ncbi:putative Zn finger protein [Oikeobacillus pervagus]|uniref:Zn finger protein n=1 Tax=Oikeobacillus pervagus TaxID=1325931 RepID=A0AAJ1WK71_9BACI|nr:putative Zn finger protein [Oikeobacillus pervagus]